MGEVGEIKVGDYARTKDGKEFGKIKVIIDNMIFINNNQYYNRISDIRTSKNPIDLIEVGDYVNGYKVEDDIEGNLRIYINSTYPSKWAYIETIKIKSILTKEQFSNIEYRLEN